MIILLVGALITGLVVSCMCSLTEAVLLSLNPLSLKVRRGDGDTVAARWLALKQNVERPIAAILIFNTVANTGLAAFAGAVFVKVYGQEWLWLFSVILTVAMLFGGEMAPKILGVHWAERLAGVLIGPLTWMMWICRPLVVVMDRFCQKLRTGTKRRHDPIMDIITLVQAAKAEQVLHNREEIIIIHAATLSARRVGQVMVPRGLVRHFNVRQTLAENVRAQGNKLHRSYPVSATAGLKEVSGYVRVRELFVRNLEEPGAGWLPLVRPVLQVDEGMPLTQLLALFLEKREIAALVRNAGGSQVGLPWMTSPKCSWERNNLIPTCAI